MRILLPLTLVLLSGCQSPDPFDRPQTWSLAPAGLNANDENLRTMLVNQQDLTAGRGEDSSTGPLAAAPVQRLDTGRRYPLPVATGTPLTSGNQGGGQQGQGQGTGGGNAASAQ
jgi:hypothetical protein